jgi:hypothetical protein
VSASESQAAQRALVRMLFDPAFAAAARQRPDEALAEVAPPLRAQLAALDPRALGRDALRRQRALAALFAEWKASTTLALLERRSYALLEGFFASAHFHRAVAERGSMALGYAAFLADLIAEGQLQTPLLADVLRLETATAQARRAAAAAGEPVVAEVSVRDDCVIALACGVLPVEVDAGALEALHAVERYLFAAGLLPPLLVCVDAPALTLPRPSPDRLQIVTVPTSTGTTLVTVEHDLYALLLGLTQPHAVRDVLAEASLRGVDPQTGRALLVELIEDELVVGAA